MSNSKEIVSNHYKSPSYTEDAFKRMRYFIVTDQLTDVVLKTGNTVVKAHRIVLSSASEYFLTMFTSGLLESKTKEVELHQVDEYAVRQLVSFAYSGVIEIKEETAESILATAVLLCFAEVVEACTDFILGQLDPSNCIGVSVFAESHSCIRLLNSAISYMEEHIAEVMDNEEFLMLPEDGLRKILSSERLNVTSELVIYRGVMKWVDYEAKRKKSLESLLSYVKLPLLPPDVLVDEVIPAIGKTSAPFLQEALSYHVLPKQINRLRASSVTPRKSTVGKLYFVAGCERVEDMTTLHNCYTTVKEYSPYEDKWTLIARKSSRRLQLGVTSLDQRLFMIGGRDGLRTLDSAEYLDLETKKWVEISPMSRARHGLGVATLESDGPIYAVGGHDGWGFLNSLERWDPGTGEWANLKPMNFPRATAAVVFLHKRLYVVGGKNGVACLNNLDAYDPLSGKWSSCATMLSRRGGVAAVVLYGRLYAIGGYDLPTSTAATRYSSVERYDPRNNKWESTSSMSLSRDGMGAAVLGNKIYAVGGFDGQNYLQKVEEYDPFSETWNHVAPINVGRIGACGVYKKCE